MAPSAAAGTQAHRWGWVVRRVVSRASIAQPAAKPSSADPVIHGLGSAAEHDQGEDGGEHRPGEQRPGDDQPDGAAAGAAAGGGHGRCGGRGAVVVIVRPLDGVGDAGTGPAAGGSERDGERRW